MSKSRLWLTIEIIAAVILCILVGFFIKRKIDDYNYLQEQKMWKDSLELSMDKGDKSPGDWLEERNKKAIDQINEIRKQHKTVIGLIEVPGTDILFPVVQGNDNWYYLDHDKDGNKHVFGEIFLDSRNSSDFADKNSIIYGHNIRQAKTLFHTLINYGDQNFYEDHKIINLYTLKGFKSYQVIQTFHAEPEEPYRQMKFANEGEYLDFLHRYQEVSMVKTDYPHIENREKKNLITLSTCFDKKTRMVIQALEVVE